jgi:hypothetical protein
MFFKNECEYETRSIRFLTRYELDFSSEDSCLGILTVCLPISGDMELCPQFQSKAVLFGEPLLWNWGNLSLDENWRCREATISASNWKVAQEKITKEKDDTKETLSHLVLANQKKLSLVGKKPNNNTETVHLLFVES